MASPLHAHRLDVVAAHVAASGARSVLDLGCGPGDLIERLLGHPQFERIVALDSSSVAVAMVAARFAGLAPRVSVRHASFTQPDPELVGFDAAALVETIEHVDPQRLGEVEQAVMGCFRPEHLLITTPNRDYNPLHGLRPEQRRHPDHRFEWGRDRFRTWARRAAASHGYRVTFFDVGEVDPEFGASTQMARFEAQDARARGSMHRARSLP